MSRDHRFRELLRDLRRQVVEAFLPGDALPAERALAATHGVGTTTLQRAMKVLRDEGLVASAPRVGWKRLGDGISRLPHKKPRVGMISRRSLADWPSHEIYPALLAEADRRGIEVVKVGNRFQQAMSPRRARPELALVPWSQFDVALLVEVEDTETLSLPILQRKLVVVLDQYATFYGLHSVTFADREAGAIAARHLSGLGHRRFAVTEELIMPGFPYDATWLHRRHGFEEEVCRLGGTIMPQWRVPCVRRGSYPDWHQLLRTQIAGWARATPRSRPTAMFALSEQQATETAQALEHHGLRVPADFSIVTVGWNGRFWGGAEARITDRRATFVDMNMLALVRRAFDAMEILAAGAAQGPKPRSPATPQGFVAPVLLVAGDTTAAAAGSAKPGMVV
jgi:DNA-binding LacI/PurR family transcriptional regulator